MKGSELNESGMYRTDLEDAEAKESGKPYRKMLESFREGILSGRLQFCQGRSEGAGTHRSRYQQTGLREFRLCEF